MLNLPLNLYGHTQSLRYGFSVQSWAVWFADKGKALLLTWLLGTLIAMLLLRCIRHFPRRWWLVFWAATIPMVLLGIFATPYIIDPLFNHYEPLARTHPALVQQMEQVAQRGDMNIPPKRMFLMKASDKVTLVNASVNGFGASKRVVVWDTSIQKATPDEILFLFGHESGHYVLNHIAIGFVLSTLGLLPLLYLGSWATGWLLQRCGLRWGVLSQTDWGLLAVLLLVFSVLSAAVSPITSAVRRRQEHAADVYGQEAIHGIVADPQASARNAFQMLGENTFDDPNPSPFFGFWTDGHPATGWRAAFAAHYDPWAPGMQPRYFPKP